MLRNPDGVYVEIMEDDPSRAPGSPEQIGLPGGSASVTLSVPDLARSEAFFPWARTGALVATRAIARARGALGARRRPDTPAPCSLPAACSWRSSSISIRRAAAPGRLPDLRPGHPQHRLRRAEQA